MKGGVLILHGRAIRLGVVSFVLRMQECYTLGGSRGMLPQKKFGIMRLLLRPFFWANTARQHAVLDCDNFLCKPVQDTRDTKFDWLVELPCVYHTRENISRAKTS